MRICESSAKKQQQQQPYIRCSNKISHYTTIITQKYKVFVQKFQDLKRHEYIGRTEVMLNMLS